MKNIAPTEWQVIPSIELTVGEHLKQFFPDTETRPVINIDVEAASLVLSHFQRQDAKPGTVHLNLCQQVINTDFKEAISVMHPVGCTLPGKEPHVIVSAINSIGFPVSRETLQTTIVHELKHAADFASPSATREHDKYIKRVLGWRGKLILLRLLAAESDPNSEETMRKVAIAAYNNSPSEIAAYGTAEKALELPSVVTFLR